MTLWRTEWRNWVNRTIYNHQKSPHQSVINFGPEPRETWSSREILPKDLKLSHQLMQKKHIFKLPRLIITTTKVFFFSLNTRKMTQSDYAAMILLWHVNYRDTQMWFHNFSTAVSAQHTTHASILFQNIKSHIFLLNLLASFQVQIWLNKTKPVTRCLQSGKKTNIKVRQSTDS